MLNSPEPSKIYAVVFGFFFFFPRKQGPIWRAVRGQGLAYSYYFQMNGEEGLVVLYLGRSSQVAEAYRVTEKIVVRHFSNPSFIYTDNLGQMKSTN